MTTGDTAGADLDDPRPRAIVALGASAGGLAPLEEFFSTIPEANGLAYVVVTHQHASKSSMMAQILARKTKMPVAEIAEATRAEPDHVYTIRPGYYLSILDGVLQPRRADQRDSPSWPIDYFLRSLAVDQKERAIGIILSGTGSDGALGLKEIKAELGLAVVQDETTAQYGSMPHNAIATAAVDCVLPVSEMWASVLAYTQSATNGRGRAFSETAIPSDGLREVLIVLRDRMGRDFTQYKRDMVGRRVERRMHLLRIGHIERYLNYLLANPDEMDLLFHDLLIGVTSFFRDNEFWDALCAPLRALLEDRPEDTILRAWVPGCATGEEAYSLAMVLCEQMDALARHARVQIFATDLDSGAIDIARAGVYGAGIASDVTAGRLARFFVGQGDGYRVAKSIRELIVFAPHDVISDPPFTKIDLLSCRNLLIYLDTQAQAGLLPIFHYALNPGGLLLLGSSETPGPRTDLFSVVDKKWKIYRRQVATAGTLPAEFAARRSAIGKRRPPVTGEPSDRSEVSELVNRMLLHDLVPPTVIARESGEVVFVHGRTGRFLETTQGPASTANVLQMARGELRSRVSLAIKAAATRNEEVVDRSVPVQANGDAIQVDVRVRKIQEPAALRGLFRVSFDHVQPAPKPRDSRGLSEATDRLAEAESELLLSLERNQGSVDALQAANEDLLSLNEELQSSNEELQSANEELESSREEMQSMNEELQTANNELQVRLEELSRANSDMKNLLDATSIAMMFLDKDLCIKRYTEPMKRLMRLIPGDLGRPVDDLTTTLQYPALVDDGRQVLRTLVAKDVEVASDDGTRYLVRILPYRTTENVIDGLVVTFVDVTWVRNLQQQQERLLGALNGSLATVVGYDANLKIRWASGPVFGKTAESLIGQSDDQILAGPDSQLLVDAKKRALATGVAEQHHIVLEVDGRERKYDLYIEPRRDIEAPAVGLVCLIVDVTGNPWAAGQLPVQEHVQ